MIGDEGDGGGKAGKGCRNNEQDGMINEMEENEFLRKREEHHGEMVEWKQ